MTLITTTEALAEFCAAIAADPYIAVDTEFLRDTTYWPKLCLIQVAGAFGAAAIDTLADGLDLAPLLALFDRPDLVKVFHAGRQDMEIFFYRFGRLPVSVFDTQLAAAVLGFGDSIAYDRLVAALTPIRLDKSGRFTDWSARPLTDRQMTYALADVIHLRTVYEKLVHKLERAERAEWTADDHAELTSPDTYSLDPEEAWERLKPRPGKASPRFLAVLKTVCAWREREAQKRDLPRVRIVRDEVIQELAAHPPAGAKDLAKVRGLSQGFAEGKMGQGLLAAVKAGLALPESEIPQLPMPPELPAGRAAAVELLRVLLKMKAEECQVAPRLLATSDELDRIASGQLEQTRAGHGWRAEVFGREARDLCAGRVAMRLKGERVELLPQVD